MCTYLIILYFLEGALRKWVLPGMTNVIPIMHAPFLLYILFVGIRYNLIRNWIAIGLMIISAISAVAAINAVYNIALQLKNAVLSFAQNVQRAMDPQITKSYAAGDLDAIIL